MPLSDMGVMGGFPLHDGGRHALAWTQSVHDGVTWGWGEGLG